MIRGLSKRPEEAELAGACRGMAGDEYRHHLFRRRSCVHIEMSASRSQGVIREPLKRDSELIVGASLLQTSLAVEGVACGSGSWS